MPSQFPAEDPPGGSFLDRTSRYVWRNPVLRWVLFVTLADHVAAIAMAFAGVLAPVMAGTLGMLSVLTWFFAVVLPLMNREVRASAGATGSGYWGELVEKFGRIVLFAQTGLYTALLAYTVL